MIRGKFFIIYKFFIQFALLNHPLVQRLITRDRGAGPTEI